MPMGKSLEEKIEGSSVKLRSFFQKLQRGLPLVSSAEEEDAEQHATVPEDVPEGHFAVLAIEGDEVGRFIVDLGYLNEPTFLRLLEKAEEEYGFGQKGALTIPCQPQELQKILQCRRRKARNCAVFEPCYAPIVDSF